MKKITLFLLLGLWTISLQAATYYPAEIYKTNGEKQECLVSVPGNNDTEIEYKIAEKSKSEKIKSEEISKIVYYDEEGKVAEIEYLPYINYKNTAKGKDKVEKPKWLIVITRGPVTLYCYRDIKRSQATGGTTFTTIFEYYLCKRATEDVPKVLSLVDAPGVKVMLSPFPKTAAQYFEDYPELANKIKNKEKNYKYNDIIEIVMEYNIEKSGKSKSK